MKSRNLTDKEIILLSSNLPTLRDKCLFVLGIKTGFRISELLSLTIKDVVEYGDLKDPTIQLYGNVKDTITVHRRNMKGKRESRSLPLHSGAKDILTLYIASGVSGALFPITRQHAWRILKGAARRAGLTGAISTHSMRKTFGMNVYNRTDKNIVAAQRALGHKSLASTSCYLSVGQEIVDSAILA